MRRVTEVPAGPEFEKWRIRAEKARDKALADRSDLRESVWKAFRDIFLDQAFHYKCAYCESDHSAGFPPQVEHYRPKAKVTESRKPIPGHDGYRWLAFEWWNLLLACHNCNTKHTDPRGGGSHPGKLNEFPVRSPRVTVPGADPSIWRAELAAEDPLLLNPYDDHPDDHLTFDLDTGLPLPVNGSEKARATIEVCHLDRISLSDRRLTAAYEGIAGWRYRILNGETIDGVIPDSAEFSRFKRRYLQREIQNLLA